MALSDVDISPGFVTQLSVTPTLTVTTEAARKRFNPEERMCYFDEEYRFKYLPKSLYRWDPGRNYQPLPTVLYIPHIDISDFTYLDPNCTLIRTCVFRYGLSNCLFAATYDKILADCACVPFFHTLAWLDFPEICAGRSLYCMNKILADIGSHTHAENTEGVKRPCFSPCFDQTNKMAVTTSVFPNLNTFTLGPEFCALYRKLLSTCRWALRCINAVHS